MSAKPCAILSMWPVIVATPPKHDRRSIYLFVKRAFRLPMLDTFDAPDTAESCPAPRSLDRRSAGSGADEQRVDVSAGGALRRAAREVAKIPWARRGNWRWVALPMPTERAQAQEYLARNSLERLCLLLFNMSEFLYVN